MMKLGSRILLAGVYLWHVKASVIPRDIKFSALVVFGDSYTDQGVHQYRPDANGVVGTPKTVLTTGGRVWPQYVGQYSGALIYDYAVSGADCDASIAPSKRSGVKQDQVPAFLADNTYVNATTGQPALHNPSAETVYAIWIGTNDLGNAGYLTESQSPRTLSVTNYTDCVFAQLDRLYVAGARNFVLMNLVPLDLTPQYALPANGGQNAPHFWTDKLSYDANITRSSEKMREYSTLANAVYHYQVPYEVKLANRYPASSFALFDTHSLFSDIWHSPSKYLNGTLPYNVTGFITQCGSTCATGATRDSYMWYDELHPSEQTDRIVAKEFVNVVHGKSTWASYWTSL